VSSCVSERREDTVGSSKVSQSGMFSLSPYCTCIFISNILENWHACPPASGLIVRLAPDAWASRTLLLHIDRRYHHNARAIVSCMVVKVQTQDYRATTEQTCSSLVQAPFSIPLRTFPPYTRVAPNTAEASRGTVVLGQGFLRTVRRVDEWGGDSGDTSPPLPHP
jgi:hypothetical protein